MDEHSPQEEIAANYIWLKPMVRQWPTSVPGALVLTDVFLHLATKRTGSKYSQLHMTGLEVYKLLMRQTRNLI